MKREKERERRRARNVRVAPVERRRRSGREAGFASLLPFVVNPRTRRALDRPRRRV